MDVEKRYSLITRNTIEIITHDELRDMLNTNSRPRGYWGFECSGFIHIGMGLITGRKIIDAINAGIEFIILLADWHSWINNKLGGDFENIRLAGEYFIHGFTAIGVPKNRVKYVWASDIVDDPKYWETIIKIGKSVSLNRVIRALPIMGRRSEDEVREFAWLIYPLMQVADIFTLNLDMAFAGIDQRKAHMLARDVSKRLGFKSPICIHTPLLPSLYQPVPTGKEEKIYTKMSKSKPESGIFIHDSEEDVRRKIIESYCPPNDIETNPLFYLLEYIIFPNLEEKKKGLMVKVKGNGEVEFKSLPELKTQYAEGKIHPLDLKLSIIEELNNILMPIRKYFSKHSEILEEMKRIVQA